MPIPVILPITNPENNTGYALILANQLFIVFAGLTGNFCIEIWFSIIVTTDVIQYSLDESAIGVERNETVTIRKLKLRNVLVQIQVIMIVNFYNAWFLCLYQGLYIWFKKILM